MLSKSRNLSPFLLRVYWDDSKILHIWIFRPSSVEYASKLHGSNASSYLSPSSMSDTENNNNHDKLEDPRPASPLRFSRKRPASADLEGDIIEEDESLQHFKRRHPSPELLAERSSFDYLPQTTSGNPSIPSAPSMHVSTASAVAELEERDRQCDRSSARSNSPSLIKDELSLRDISMLRNPDEHDSRSNIKRENYWKYSFK